jgi:filamentous hemagglutinin family protein
MLTDRGGIISRGTISVQLRRVIVRIVRAPSAVLEAFRPIGHLPFLASVLAVALAPNLGWAQHITVDGRFSAAQTLVGPNYSIGANLGKQVGSNLFHSFGQFGLATGESATFSGPATISNVIGRVTGGNPSSIDGKVQSNIVGANLYLINPSGIVFGPNATVNVSGSFHASTADYLKMSDGAKFQATNPDGSTLSAASPAAFGFLNASPAAITVNGSTLGPVPGTLGLVAGPVSVTGPSPTRAVCAATLCAPGGTIHVTSAAGVGEVPVDPHNTSALTVTSFGPVDIKGRAKLDVSNPSGLGSGGSVFIRSGALTIDASQINGDNYGSGAGGVLSLRGDNQITLSNSANVHAVAMGGGNGADVLLSAASSGVILVDAATVLTDSRGPRNGGSITVVAGQLTLQNGANVLAQSSGPGSGGDVIASVGGSLTVDSAASLGSLSTRAGDAGNVTVTAEALTIANNGLVRSNTSGMGKSGSVSVSVSGMLSVNGSSGVPQSETGISGDSKAKGDAGKVTVSAGTLSIVSGTISSSTFTSGNGGSISVNVAGGLTIDGAMTPGSPTGTGIISQANGSIGNAGSVAVSAGTLSIVNTGEISSSTFGSGDSGNVLVNVAGGLTIDGTKTPPGSFTGISSQTNPGSMGNAGTVSVSAGAISIVSAGEISSVTFGRGNGGSVLVSVAGGLTIIGNDGSNLTGIATDSEQESMGNAGFVRVIAGDLTLADSGEIASGTFGRGAGGQVSVSVAGALSIDGAIATTHLTGITSTSETTGAGGNAGSVIVRAGSLSIVNGGKISATTAGSGKGGDIAVAVTNGVTLSGGGPNGASGITASAQPQSSGQAGEVVLTAGGAIALSGGAGVTSSTAGTGNGGTVQVNAQGPLSLTDPRTAITASASNEASGSAGSVIATAPQVTISAGAQIASTTEGTGAGGSVTVTTPGALVLDGAGVANTQIAASAIGPQSGLGGSVTVTANSLTVEGGAQIASKTAGPGAGGDIAVTLANGVTLSGVDTAGAASGITASAGPGSSGQAGQVVLTAGGAIALSGGAKAASSTAGSGNGGTVQVAARGILTLTDPGTGITASAESGSSGNAGSVAAAAPQITIASGAEIASTTAGTGMGGSVTVTTPGMLVLDGAGLAGNTEIAASATGTQSGPGGSVTIMADALAIEGGARIASTTFGPGKAGDIAVTVANGVTLSGTGPTGASGITAAAQSGSSGQAGEVALIAGGAIALSGGAKVTSSTFGAGNGGTVEVIAQGPLSVSDPGSGIIASATGTASGNAGSVTVRAPQITLTTGAEIASTTGGTGAGGSVMVATPGMLALDGAGVANTQIAASATGPQSGPGGSVMVQADALTIEGGAQIASSTAGPGKGGDVNIAVASDIVLPDAGPQITARSTGSGDAGSITVSATRLVMNNGAAISTEAAASTANGGNITLHVRDFLYLTSSEISTSVKGETGNGGNIAIDPQLVILDHSSIIAQAVEGHGGNITITADQFIPSSDSVVSASSELGISGTIVINGPRVDVNGALVVLSTQLRSRTEVLREACAARAGQPISSLVEAGRGGLPQDPEATLPALYIAGRDLNPNPQPGNDTVELSGPAIPATARLTMRCS